MTSVCSSSGAAATGNDARTAPRTLIVIVNYGTSKLVVDCLRSLQPEVATLGNCYVVVADNASPDDSLSCLQEAVARAGWGDWVRVDALRENRGFAAGNNHVITREMARPDPPDYVLLLNPDTVVHPGGVTVLTRFLQQHPQVGIAGSRLENPDGTPQCSAFRFHTLWSEIDQGARWRVVTRLLDRWVVAPPPPTHGQRTDWVSGASMMVRAEVLRTIGLLDERYFMYFEEVDFCYRAAQAGWTCWYVPASRVVHLVGQASGVGQGNLGARRLPAYWFESRRRYFTKHHGLVYTALADLGWVGTHVVWRAWTRWRGRPRRDPPYLLRDFVRHSIGFGRGP